MGGIIVQTLAFAIMGTAVGLADDMGKGVVDRFRSLPMARSAVLAGRALADMLSSLIALAVLVVAGLIIGWGIHDGVGSAIAGFALVLLFAYAMTWAGILLGLLVRTPDAAQGFVFVVIFPLTFLANTFVSTGDLPSGCARSRSGTRSARSSPRCATCSATRPGCRPTRPGRSSTRSRSRSPGAWRSSPSACRSRCAATARRRRAEPGRLAEGLQRRFRVGPPHADPEPVGRHVAELGGVDRRRQEHDAGLLDQVAAERLDAVGAEVAREADAARLRRLPREQVGVLGEERLEDRHVARR